ncbi:MAG: T9SS type A sorting domain-containing protein, partial [Candidatus Limisoma sp.]
YSFDAAKQCVTFEVPMTACSSETNVVVEYYGNTAIDAISGSSSKVSYDAQRRCLVATFPQVTRNIAVTVCNSLGKQMLEQTYNKVNSFSIDLSKLSPQLYISRVVADDRTYICKFINN